jgi:site-specific DNA-methyltransferase (adenine-specific)
MEYKLLLGDCLDRLKEIEDCSVDSVVTDPPYHLTSIVKRYGKEGSSPAKFGTDGAFQRASKGFMGQEWDGGDIAFRTEVWEQCLRVLKPGGHILAFSGSRTYHRMAVAIEDAGFEIRDQIMWVYGSGFPKSHNVGKKLPQYEGWGTALKPAHEPICLARKPLEKKTVADNVLEFGTGAINIDGCRVDDVEIYVSGKGNKFVDSLPHGKRTGENVKGVFETHIGRYPANFIHDGSEEVLESFPRVKGGNWVHTEGARHFNNNGEPTNPTLNRSDKTIGSAARFFYCPKASKKDRNEGCESLEQKQYSLDGREKPIENAYQRNNSIASNNHPTVKPTDLMRYLIRLVTPENGTVLDPFMGSGSTGKAAMLENKSFIGIELSKDYLDIVEKRIKHVITDIE